VLSDARVLAVSGIGEPEAFVAQLQGVGAHVDAVVYRDHHTFSVADAEELARRAGAVDRVVCTLKDAVKLGPHWPRDAPALWYVSQRVIVEHGDAALVALIERVIALRSTAHAPGAAETTVRALPARTPSRRARLPQTRPVSTGTSDIPHGHRPSPADFEHRPPDKDRFLNEENPFEAMMSRFDRAAVLLDLDPGSTRCCGTRRSRSRSACR
jgi:hypothetical protein